ncbi:MAG: DNA repair protein RadC [Gammaproteobacteria bacterium]
MLEEEQPQYRLEHLGEGALSLTELLAVVIGSGHSDDNILELTRLLVELGGLPGIASASIAELTIYDGIGRAKAGRIKAALELGRRLVTTPLEKRTKINSPADAASLLLPDMMFLEQEHLVVVLLNTRNEVLSTKMVYKGSLNTAVIRIAEVFKDAIRQNAAALIVAHNHPSGDPAPSPEDLRVTREIVNAGKLLSIDVLDHVIIGHNRYTSLKERRLGFD